jgi:hypothetical protein
LVKNCIFSIFSNSRKDEILKTKNEEKITNLSGSYYFPNSTINNFIFSDILMNVGIFYDYAFIDEKLKATKKKNTIYIQTNDGISGALLSQNTDKILFLENKKIDKNLPHVRVKIRYTANQKTLENFQFALAKIMTYYNTNFTAIEKIYKTFLPTFNIYQTFKDKNPQESKLIPINKNKWKSNQDYESL